MRFVIAAVLAFFHVSLSARDALVIEHVDIVSPHLASAQEDMNVLVVDGRIEAISREEVVPVPGTRRLDGEGLYLVPGIFDGHVHVSSIPGMGFGAEPVARENPELAAGYFRQQPKSFLYYGVTQVVDPNPGLSWKRFTDAARHPDYFRCEVITSKDTFPLVEKTDEKSKALFGFLVDEDAAPNQPGSSEAIVEAISQSGAMCIKIYFENGYGNADHWPLLSAGTLKRIRKAASEKGLLILAHANALDMYQQAVAADVDVIAHGMWNWGEYGRSAEFPEQIAEVLGEMMSRRIGYMPTQRIIAGLGELMVAGSQSNPDFEDVTPPELLQWYTQPESQWFKQELRAGFDGLPDQVIADIFIKGLAGKGEKVTAHLDDAAYPILLGSDFPGSPTYANQPGLTTFLEMKGLFAAGLTLSEVLAASTINNARQFNLDADYGTVEEGKFANLLLLGENPLRTIDAWDSIEFVVLHGEVIERAALSAKRTADAATELAGG